MVVLFGQGRWEEKLMARAAEVQAEHVPIARPEKGGGST